MNETTTIFETNQSKSILARFKAKIESIIPKDDFDKQRNSLIRLIVSAMEKNPKEWDENCQINIKWIGDQFLNRLSSEEKELNKENLDDICSMCFRFLFELYLSIKNDLSIEFEAARRFVFNNIDHFENSARDQIEYAIKEMPVAIFKSIANSDEIRSIKEFNTLSAKACSLKDSWEQEIQEKEERVNQIKISLDTYKNAFNFVGLYQGFDDLAKDKNLEKDNILFWLRIASAMILLPILMELFIIYANINNISAIKDGLALSLIPALSLSAISIYYFRVLLSNYKSVKSQLLQIDLRKTLCRFIQSYADYSTEIKKKDAGSLDKFESIIFSGVVSDEGNIPSAYDGVEQIGKIFKSLKG